MDIKMQVRYSSENDPWMCFRHAVQAAMDGANVETTIDDYGSEYYLGRTSCELCYQENKATDNL